jgi:hypothetical protein
MVQECSNPECDRTIRRWSLYPNYCSQYCDLFVAQGRAIINGKEKFGKHQFVGFNWMPKIMVDCQWCGKPNCTLTNSVDNKNGNSVFCDINCRNEGWKGKNTQKHYWLLRTLQKLKRPVVAGDMARYMEEKAGCIAGSSRMVGSIMRSYIKHGFVTRTQTNRESTTYEWTYRGIPIPLCKIIRQVRGSAGQKGNLTR